MPERLEGKLSRAVLRGLGDSNVSWLPDYLWSREGIRTFYLPL
jgi:hypothetical protein